MSPRTILRCVAAATLMLALVPVGLSPRRAAADGAAELTLVERDELEAAVRQLAADVFHERDESGRRFKRATWGKRFVPDGDDGYTVVFTVDTAKDQRMVTERFTLSLRREGRRWVAGERTLEDSWDSLVRDLPGNERFARFDSFEFEREGLKISAAGGTLVIDDLLGRPSSIELASPRIEWSYAPPSDLGPGEAARWHYAREKRPENLDFAAERVIIGCDAETCEGLLDRAFGGVEPIDRAAIDRVLAKSYDDRLETWRKRLDESGFVGFRRPPRPGHRHWTVVPRGAKDDEWFGMAYDNEDGREVSVRASGFGLLALYNDELTRGRRLSQDELERRPDGLQSYDLLALRGSVDMALEEAELITGDLTVTLRAQRDLDTVGFGLRDVSAARGRGSSDRDPALTVNLLETGDGVPLTWVRLGTAGGLIKLPQPVARGETLELHIVFRNTGSLFKHSPSYTYVDRSGWLPFVSYNDPIETFDLTLRVPAKFEPLGVGNEVSRSTKDGVTTAHYVARRAHFPTVIFGDYESDRPRTQAEKLDGTPIPVAIHVDRVGMSDWQIRPKQLRPLAEQAVNALNLYREIYGVDYPYDKLDLVNDPLGSLYGQSPASIVYLGSAAFRGSGTLGSANFISPGEITKFTRSLVAHEVGHQWWGSLIGNANQRNYWFVESLAEYSSALFVEATNSDQGRDPERGYRAYLHHVAGWRREILDTEPLASVKDAPLLWNGGGYRAALYSKGPYAFHMLRVLFGQEKMFAFLRDLGRELQGSEIVTSDIERVAEYSFHADLGWFFDQWIRGVGTPRYTIEYATRPAEDGTWVVSGDVLQQVVLGRDEMEMPGVYFRGLVPITVTGRDHQEYTVRLAVEGPRTEFGFKVPVAPQLVELNKYGETLAHDVDVVVADAKVR